MEPKDNPGKAERKRRNIYYKPAIFGVQNVNFLQEVVPTFRIFRPFFGVEVVVAGCRKKMYK